MKLYTTQLGFTGLCLDLNLEEEEKKMCAVMPVNSANTQLQCPEFMGFLLCSPPAVAPLYDLKVNTCVIFHKISNNNMSVRSETQCLWDLTMLGGRNLFKKKEKKKKKAPTIQRR